MHTEYLPNVFSDTRCFSPCTQQIGALTPEERLQKILRYRAKRQMRNFNRTIKYQCRKSLADTRPRVRGRFARDNEPGSVMPHETKKAIREKTVPSSGGGGPMAASSPGSQDEEQMLHAGSASPSMKSEPIQQLQAPGPVGSMEQMTAVFGAGGTAPASLLEQHASLAQLYNQWSEIGVPSGPPPPQQQAGQQRLQGTSSNSA